MLDCGRQVTTVGRRRSVANRHRVCTTPLPFHYGFATAQRREGAFDGSPAVGVRAIGEERRGGTNTGHELAAHVGSLMVMEVLGQPGVERRPVLLGNAVGALAVEQDLALLIWTGGAECQSNDPSSRTPSTS
jgi:hypothetical protein